MAGLGCPARKTASGALSCLTCRGDSSEHFPNSGGEAGEISTKVTSAIIHVSEESHIIAVWEKTLIQIWRKDPSPDAIVRTARIGARLVSESNQATHISIVEATSGPPNEQARAELAKFTKDSVSKMAAAVIVTEGSGFRSAVVRGVGVTLTALAPHKVPYKFVSSVTEGVAILLPYLPASAGGGGGLRDAIEELRNTGTAGGRKAF